MTQIEIIPILNDNYAYLLRGKNGQNAIVDPGEAKPVIDYLETNNLSIDLIINTHHHWDHVNGNDELKNKYKCPIAAPNDKGEISLQGGRALEFDGDSLDIIATPAHTLDHICLYSETGQWVITGDTLFVMGCGRLFEGTAEMLFQSFQKLRALPDDTRIYCGHEYTLSNAEFCHNIAPENNAITQRLETIRRKRANDEITIPSTIGEEKDTNLFFMARDVMTLAELRQLKDNS